MANGTLWNLKKIFIFMLPFQSCQLYLGVFKKYINLDNSKSEQRPKNKIPKATSQGGINLPSKFIIKVNKKNSLMFKYNSILHSYIKGGLLGCINRRKVQFVRFKVSDLSSNKQVKDREEQSEDTDWALKPFLLQQKT